MCIIQDMVVEFARMNMHQLLEETEKAVSISEVLSYVTHADFIFIFFL